ncbi:MAG: hydrolase [Clostridiaceae bacterium]
MIEVPEVIRNASGIRVFGKRIKSLVFSTDIAVIRNTNADAIIAVYPFTPQPVITEAILNSADIPVFCGVGGGITTGKRVVNLALDAEFKGAMGVVVNSPTPNEIIRQMRETIDIPIVVTVVSEFEDIDARIEAGVTILNVSGAKKTAQIVRMIREKYPEFPIIATGGPTDETISETIAAGANAITYTPPLAADLLNELMVKYRRIYKEESAE